MHKRSGWPRWRRMLACGVGLSGLVVSLLYCGFIYYYVEWSLSTVNRDVCCETPADWGFAYEALSIASNDGVMLAGWYVPPQDTQQASARTGTAIILLHGDGSDRMAVKQPATWLAEAGFGVVLLDLPGHGESEAPRRTFGWEDLDDMDVVVAWLQEQGADAIGIYGVSLGGQVALRAAANNPALLAVWADGPGISRPEDTLPLTADANHVLTFVTNWLADRYQSYRLDTTPPPSVKAILPDIAPRPIYMVAGGNAVDRPITAAFQRIAGDNATRWLVEDTGHTEAFSKFPAEYRARLIPFFEAALVQDIPALPHD